MGKKKELGKNTILIFISKFCTSFITFLLIPLYTRFLTTSDYGYIDLIQTYINLLVPIIILRFDSGVFRFLIDTRNDEEGTKNVLSISLLVTAIQSALFIIFAIIVNIYFNIQFFEYILFNIICVAVSQIFLQASRGIGKIKEFSIASITCGVACVLLNVIFIAILRYDSRFIFVSNGLGNVIAIIYLWVSNKYYKYIKLHNIDKSTKNKMLKYSIPMIPDGLSWWIVNVSDRTIITAIIGTAANGIYAISGKFSNIMAAIFGVFNMTWQESASLHIDDKDRDTFFSEIYNGGIIVYSSICLLLTSFMPLVFKFLVGNEFLDAYKYIPILLVGNIFNGLAGISGGVYIAKKNTKSVAKTTMFAAIINIIINVLLIYKVGLMAAAISTAISYMILAIYRFIDSKKYVSIIINWLDITKLIVICIFSIALYYMNNKYLNIINAIITFLFVLLINRNNICKALLLFKRKVKGDKNE